MRLDDYTAATRSRTMPRATASSAPILALARGLLEDARPAVRERGLTLLGVTVSNLDAVRDRFGPAAVTRASLIGRDPGLAAWLPPG